MRRALTLLLVLVCQTGFASDETTVMELLPDPRETFSIGFAELETGRLPAGQGFVATTFPLLLYEEVRSIRSRLVAADEQRAYLDARVLEATVAAARELTGAVAARDALLFSGGSDARARARAREEADERVRQAREQYALLADAELATPEPAPREIAFLEQLERGELTRAPNFTDDAQVIEADLLALAEELDLDLLIYGTAIEQAGYLIVDLFAFHRFQRASTLLSSVVRLPEEIGLDARPIADEIAEALRGRPWGEIVITSSDSRAAIRVNDTLVGLGSAELRYADPGTYRIFATLPGYPDINLEVPVAAGESVPVLLQFAEIDTRPITLRSSPAGADVYVENIWVGETPLDVEFPAGPSLVTLRLDGFLDSQFVVDEGTPPVVSRALLTSQIDWTVELKRERDEFYNALGFFVLSVPVTLLLWGGFQNVVGTQVGTDLVELSVEEEARLVRMGNTFYWSAVGGLAVNIGLLTNMLFALMDYIAVGEGAHNQ